MWYHLNLTYSSCLLLTLTQIQRSVPNDPHEHSVPSDSRQPNVAYQAILACLYILEVP